jgi:hypothetical protein
MQGAKNEHFFFKNPKSNCFQIVVSAGDSGLLSFKVTPRTSLFIKVKDRLEATCREIAHTLNIPTEIKVDSEKTSREILITTSMLHIAGKSLETEEIEDKLVMFHKPLLLALER